MEARNRTVQDWLRRVGSGETVLPRFQRFEAWGSSVIQDFLTSVIRDLPTGSSLVLEVGGEVPFESRTISGVPESGPRIHELLLDGQQRLTALWRSLNDGYPDKTYIVSFDNPESPEVIGITRWKREGKRYPIWVDQPQRCWERRTVPLRLLNPGNTTEYGEWAKEAAGDDARVQVEILQLLMKERGELANFNLPYLSLPSNTDKETAIEVFIKLNTTLARLTAFDIVVAQLEEAKGESLHELVSNLTARVPKISAYVDAPNYVLSVSALLQDKTPNQRGYFTMDLKTEFDRNWPDVIAGTERLVRFLEAEGVLDRDRLPTESVLPVLAALWAHAPDDPDKLGNARILLRKYLWRSFFTERYDRGVSGAALQDFRGIRGVMTGETSETEVPCFDRSAYGLPDKNSLSYARWPKYRDRLGRSILLLSMRGKAEDVKDGSPISRDTIGQRQYHHVFPRAWLREKDEEAEPDKALNCILIGRRANLRISAKEPITYLLETSEASTLGEEEVRRRLATHLVDFDLLAEGDYGKYIERRAEACAGAIESLCNGQDWIPPIG